MPPLADAEPANADFGHQSMCYVGRPLIAGRGARVLGPSGLLCAAAVSAGQGISIIDPPAPAPLPAAPIVERWLFESPWMLMALLIVGGVAAAYVLGKRAAQGSKAPRVSAAAGVGTALLVLVISTLVTTARETVSRRTRELVAAVAAGNADAVDEILSDECVLVATLPFLEAASMPKTAIVQRVTIEFGANSRNGRSEATVLEVQAWSDVPDFMRVQAKVRVRAEGWNFPTLSWWRLEWRRNGANAPWRATGIQALSATGVGSAPP